MKSIQVYIDGASRGNPGKAGAGAYLRSTDNDFECRLKKYLAKMTNNQAEYSALIMAFEYIAANKESFADCKNIMVYSDSELLVRQMTGLYKIKSPNLIKMHIDAHRLMDRMKIKISFQHIPREKNREADGLANLAIDEAMQGNSEKF